MPVHINSHFIVALLHERFLVSWEIRQVIEILVFLVDGTKGELVIMIPVMMCACLRPPTSITCLCVMFSGLTFNNQTLSV